MLVGPQVSRLALLVVLAASLALGSLPPRTASAAQEARCASDYSRLAQDGAYIFVMLAREEVSRDNPAGCIRPDDALRARYPVSGLYRVSGAPEPMWVVDWYAPAVTVSGDGRHLVRWGPLAPEGDYSALALAFYDSGRVIASYPVERLVNFPYLLPVIEGHYTWVHDFELHEESGRLTFATELGEHFIFDMATGQPLSNWVPPVPRYWVAAGAVATLLVSLPVLAMSLRRKPEPRSGEAILRRNAG